MNSRISIGKLILPVSMLSAAPAAVGCANNRHKFVAVMLRAYAADSLQSSPTADAKTQCKIIEARIQTSRSESKYPNKCVMVADHVRFVATAY